MIKAVLFDIGWVTSNADSSVAFKGLAKELRVKHEDIQKIYHECNVCSKINRQKFVRRLRKLSGKDLDFIELWKKHYVKALKNKNKGVIDIAKKLKKNYTVASLTNVNNLHHKWRKEKGIYDYFDLIVSSSNARINKPDPGIYKLALKRLNLKAKECVFIDDLRKNITSANKLGFKGILFKNTTKLKKDLEKAGLKFT